MAPKTQDLGFGAAGGAREKDFILAVHPVEGTAQLSGQGGLLFGGKAAAIR